MHADLHAEEDHPSDEGWLFSSLAGQARDSSGRNPASKCQASAFGNNTYITKETACNQRRLTCNIPLGDMIEIERSDQATSRRRGTIISGGCPWGVL